jgi:hypothetical protein
LRSFLDRVVRANDRVPVIIPVPESRRVYVRQKGSWWP